MFSLLNFPLFKYDNIKLTILKYYEIKSIHLTYIHTHTCIHSKVSRKSSIIITVLVSVTDQWT